MAPADPSPKKPDKGDKGLEDQDKFDKDTATSSSDRQAYIVQNLIKEGAYDIAKEFIDFIKSKKDEKAEEKN